MPFSAPRRSLAVLSLSTALFAAAPAAAADLVIEDWFAGTTYASGKFAAINGTVRRFDVVLTGRMDGEVFSLREDFVYDDGERDTKTWRFTRVGDDRYTAIREDVVAPTTVYLDGAIADFSYRVDLAAGEDRNIVRFFDRLTLGDDGTIRNTALVTKFGIPVARVEVNFARTRNEADALAP